MKKIALTVLCFFTIAMVGFALSFQAAAAEKEKKILLKVPMAYPSKLPGLGTTIIWMSERIELLSGGTMKIKIYEPGRADSGI